MKFAHLSIGLLTLLSPLTAAWSKEDREIFRIRDEISAHEENAAATFYDILGVKNSASLEDITKAYRLKTRSLHPDKIKQRLRVEQSKNPNAKKLSASEVNAAVKKAGAAQARLSLIANILRGPERDRYDHFLSNGFPLWKGTDYYYNRYRPGLGTVLTGLFIVVGGGIHYFIMYMSWKRQREFVERYIKFARNTAWGGGLNIPGVESTPAPAPAPAEQDEDAPPQPTNRRERRMQEKAAKRESGRGGNSRPARKAQASSKVPSREASTAPGGPTGTRKRVVAENGKILVVDSLGDVYLEEEDEDGNVNEFLLDPNEIPHPTLLDTAVVRAPIWLFNITAGRFIPQKSAELEIEVPETNDDSDVPQNTPSTDSAGDDFELLDKSTDSLSKAKSSGAQQGGKANKRKGKKK